MEKYKANLEVKLPKYNNGRESKKIKNIEMTKAEI